MHCVGDTTEHMERRDKSEVSSGLGQRKEGSVDAQVTTALLVVQPMNGAAFPPSGS